MIFTLPALILLGAWAEFSYLETTLIAGFGGVLGVLFTIPLRRALIIDQPLQFPEGVATAEVLKVGAEGGGGVGVLVLAGLIGAVVKVGVDRPQAVGRDRRVRRVDHRRHRATAARRAPRQPATTARRDQERRAVLLRHQRVARAARGRLHRRLQRRDRDLRAARSLNRWIAVPLFAAFGDPTRDHRRSGDRRHARRRRSSARARSTPPASMHGRVTRYLGVGGMLVGGLWSLFKLRKSLLGGITAGLDAYKRMRKGGTGSVPRTERDMPMNIILILIAASVIPLFFIF